MRPHLDPEHYLTPQLHYSIPAPLRDPMNDFAGRGDRGTGEVGVVGAGGPEMAGLWCLDGWRPATLSIHTYLGGQVSRITNVGRWLFGWAGGRGWGYRAIYTVGVQACLPVKADALVICLWTYL